LKAGAALAGLAVVFGLADFDAALLDFGVEVDFFAGCGCAAYPVLESETANATRRALRLFHESSEDPGV
jgi:hypothetical protein